MQWVAKMLHTYPELAVFLVVGIGSWVGALKWKGFGLGPVTSALIAGLVIGHLFDIPVSSTAKSVLFLLFLFAIGYSVGPRFFAAMKGDGLRWVALAVAVSVAGLAAAYAVAMSLGLDPGFAGGMVSGALTESPAIGTASEAIRTLPLAPAEQERLIAHVAVADAVCYVFGALGVIVFCSHVGPWLLRVDLQAEARRAEEALGIDRARPGIESAWRPHEMRAYRVREHGAAAGLTVAAVEARLPDTRLFIERIRRGTSTVPPSAQTVLQAGDVVVASGRREVLVEALGAVAQEVEDRELLDIPVATYEIFVSDRDVAGRTLGSLGRDIPELRGVFLRELMRGGEAIPIAMGTVVQRGDVVRVTGPEPAVVRAAGRLGRTVIPHDATDFVTLSLAVTAGAALGIALVLPVGNMRIAIGTSVGTLLAGLVVGYLNTIRPLFGRIPDGAVSFMSSFGLVAFVSMVGLGAGPHFVEAFRESGMKLFLGGIVVTTVPLLVGLYFGRYVLKLNAVLLLGGIAGALTMTAGMAAVQERSQSPVAVLGYSGTVAIGHILLTTWGTIIVHLVA